MENGSNKLQNSQPTDSSEDTLRVTVVVGKQALPKANSTSLDKRKQLACECDGDGRPRFKLEVLSQRELDHILLALLVAVLGMLAAMVIVALPSRTGILRDAKGAPHHSAVIASLVWVEILFIAHVGVCAAFMRRCFFLQPRSSWDRQQVWTACLLLAFAVVYVPASHIWSWTHNLKYNAAIARQLEVMATLASTSIYLWWMLVIHDHRVLTKALPINFYRWKVVAVACYMAVRISLTQTLSFSSFSIPLGSAIPAVRALIKAGHQPAQMRPTWRASCGALAVAACDAGLLAYVLYSAHLTGEVLQHLPLAKYRRQRLGNAFFNMSVLLYLVLRMVGSAVVLSIVPLSDFVAPPGSGINGSFGGQLLPHVLLLALGSCLLFAQAHVRLPPDSHHGRLGGWLSQDQSWSLSNDMMSIPTYGLLETWQQQGESSFAYATADDVKLHDASNSNSNSSSSRPHFALSTCALAFRASVMAYRTLAELEQILALEQQLHGKGAMQYVGHAVGASQTHCYIFRTSTHLVISFRGTASMSSVRSDLTFNLTNVDFTRAHLTALSRGADKSEQALKDSHQHTTSRLPSNSNSSLKSHEDVVGCELEAPSTSSVNSLAGGVSHKERVHSGFYRLWKSVASRVLQVVRKECGNGADEAAKRLLVCGHSMGGALAMLCTHDLSNADCGIAPEDMTVYTFGSPRIGNRAFVQEYNRCMPKTFRVMHAGDIVTKLPPTWKTLFGFKHCGTPALFTGNFGTDEVALRSNVELLVAPSFADMTIWHGLRPGSMRHHPTASYARAILAWAHKEHGAAVANHFQAMYPWNGSYTLGRRNGAALQLTLK